jgi:scyllo-inosamine 4-kinase
MSDTPADQHRDPGTLAHLKTIAVAVFARHGVDFSSARRAGGWTNATWLAGGLALRLSVRPGSDDILREARLAAFFPPEVGYPPLLESGTTDGYAWSLSRELPGRSLGEVWPELDWEARAAALRQLWWRTRAVHRVDLAALGELARKQPWFFPAGAGEADAALARLAAQGLFTPGQARVLGACLRRFRETLPVSACVLNHGDLTLDNAFWHAGEVIALFDFEYAVAAPLELDLNELVKMAFPPPGPEEPPHPPGSPAFRGQELLRSTVAELALPLLDHPGGPDLLAGYAILLELWLLEDWLAHPEGEGPLETWQPYRMLLSLADGQGGYLAPLLARVSSANS